MFEEGLYNCVEDQGVKVKFLIIFTYVVICYKHLFFSPLKAVFIWYYYLHDFLWEIKIALTILVYNGLDINIVYKQFYYSVVIYYCWICFNGLVKPVLWKKENSSLIGFFSFDRCLKKKMVLNVNAN